MVSRQNLPIPTQGSGIARQDAEKIEAWVTGADFSGDNPRVVLSYFTEECIESI